MVKENKSYNNILYCNLLVFLGLVITYFYLVDNKDKIDKIEGITNKNCCGGIEEGIHYSETDREPPAFVRRCFKSSSDGEYMWSGFPCTEKGTSECCGNNGTCIASSNGGYCQSDTGNFIYQRNSSNPRPYMKLSNDRILDITDANDMQDYFKDRDDKKSGDSIEMKRFLARRSRNEKYVQENIRKKRISDEADKKKSMEKIKEQNKRIDIISSITIVHLLFIVIFAIVIREEIIGKINGFYDGLYIKYLKFSGKDL